VLERLRRVGWGVADQAVSSLTNFALGVMVARALDSHDFGAFAIVFTTYVTLMGVGRALSSEPLMVKYSHAEVGLLRGGISYATGASILLGLVTGVVAIVVSIIATGVLSEAFFLLGPMLPGLLLQDGWRYAFFASGRGRAAFANDCLWAVTMFSVLLMIDVTGNITLRWAMISWGGGALLAAAAGIIQAKVVPRPEQAVAWLHEHRGLALRYLGEFLAIDGSGQLFLYGVGGFVGLAGVGALRGATVLLGPLHILFFGVGLVAIPDGVRIRRTGSLTSLKKMCLTISAGLATLATSWGLLLLAIPDSIGTALLGETWDRSSQLLLPYALSMAITGVTIGASTGLRALAAARRSFWARIISSPLQPIVGIGSAALMGLKAAAWSLAVTSALASCLFWWHFFQATKETETEQAPIMSVVER
jgi:O-antigen/teichoic acid export membrane protein